MTKTTIKAVFGYISSFGSGVLLGSVTRPIIKSIPNPIVRATAWTAQMVIAYAVSQWTEKRASQMFDEVDAVIQGVQEAMINN